MGAPSARPPPPPTPAFPAHLDPTGMLKRCALLLLSLSPALSLQVHAVFPTGKGGASGEEPRLRVVKISRSDGYPLGKVVSTHVAKDRRTDGYLFCAMNGYGVSTFCVDAGGCVYSCQWAEGLQAMPGTRAFDKKVGVLLEMREWIEEALDVTRRIGGVDCVDSYDTRVLRAVFEEGAL